MVDRHMKRYFKGLIIRKMQIRTTMRYYLTPVRGQQAISKIRRNWNPCTLFMHTVDANANCAATIWKTVWRYLKNLNIKLPF